MDFAYFLIFAAAGAAVFGIAALFEPSPVSFSIRRSASSGWFASRVAPYFQDSGAARLMMLQAGYEAIDAARTFQAIRMIFAVSLPLIVLIVLPLVRPDVPSTKVFFFAALCVPLGFLLPARYVGSRRKKRQDAIRKGLPDALDLLLVSTEAGLGIDTAILRVSEETAEMHPVISKCLQQMSSELRAGRPRAEAFRGFSDRCGIIETTSMINLLIQSDSLGTSMAAALRAFSDDMRAHRLLKAEEIGQKIGVKLTMVLTTCFLPALLIAIMAPAIVNIATRYVHQ